MSECGAKHRRGPAIYRCGKKLGHRWPHECYCGCGKRWPNETKKAKEKK